MSWLKRHVGQEGRSNLKATESSTAYESSNPSAPTPENKLLFQAFEWHTSSKPPAPNETHSRDSHWSRLARVLPRLSELGVTSIWLPPGCKANQPQGNGYDCYDLWDLGEFDQKWTRSTKWGSREELRDLLAVASKCGNAGVELIWDAVLNHKTAGDATDEAWAVEVHHEGTLKIQQYQQELHMYSDTTYHRQTSRDLRTKKDRGMAEIRIPGPRTRGHEVFVDEVASRAFQRH